MKKEDIVEGMRIKYKMFSGQSLPVCYEDVRVLRTRKKDVICMRVDTASETLEDFRNDIFSLDLDSATDIVVVVE